MGSFSKILCHFDPRSRSIEVRSSEPFLQITVQYLHSESQWKLKCRLFNSLHNSKHDSFPGVPRLAGVYWSKGWWRWWWQLELYVVQSSSQIITSNKPTSSFLQVGCPSCRPTNSVKALKGKISHPMDLLTPSSPGGLPTLSLTTNSSWLPWVRGVMPLISPLNASTPFTELHL